MRWQGRRQSSNIDDRRGQAPRRAAIGGGAAIVIALIAMALGADPQQVLQALNGASGSQPTSDAPAQPRSAAENELAEFSAVVLADTEDVWNRLLPDQAQRPYVEPTLVLFTDQVASACGQQSAAVGPFYCPGDQQLYIDLSFFADLQSRFGAPGDFAQAYVIAHEVGHHLQHLLGTSDRVRQQQRGMSEANANELSVRMELQADCYAGVWGHHADRAHQLLERGDLEEALGAATAIGDDTLQRRAGGRVMPESFTHGTSEQRVRWFRRGFDEGTVAACDTFAAREL